MTVKERTTQDEVQSHYAQVRAQLCEKYKELTARPDVWVTMLYGSQNYDLSTPESDVDTKTMLLPSFRSVIKGEQPFSAEFVMADGSLDACKDFRAMFENYKKGNINFVETLYSDYFFCPFYINDFYELRRHRDIVADSQPRRLMHMAAGMVQQKDVAFDKPFSGKLDVLELYGYDPKQLHHMVRLRRFMQVFMESGSFARALKSADEKYDPIFHKWVMSLKATPLPLKEAQELRFETRVQVKALLDESDSALPEFQMRDMALELLDTIEEEVMTKHLRDLVCG